jgi:hypothetical protein
VGYAVCSVFSVDWWALHLSGCRLLLGVRGCFGSGWLSVAAPVILRGQALREWAR